MSRIRDWWGEHPTARMVVLDDDPTGTQTVHDVTVLLDYDEDVLTRTLSRPENRVTFLLTNSRSLLEREAICLAEQVGGMLRRAADRAGVELMVVSRSDSTLRGHYPAEVDALLRRMGRPDAAQILMPVFLAGGRRTIDGVHYVCEGDRKTPVGETEFARDATFGFVSSRMDAWVEEKTGGRIPASAVIGIGGTVREMRATVAGLVPGQVAFVNASEQDHIEAFAEAYLGAWDEGGKPVLRSAASIVPVLAANESTERWQPAAGAGVRSGLVVAGSYVQKTTEQLDRLRVRYPDACWCEIDPLVAQGEEADAHIEEVANRVDASLGEGGVTILVTGRALVRGRDADDSRQIGRRIADVLNRIVARLEVVPSFVVAKGGITSSDVAQISLGARSAWVLGQILPGVPVWRLDSNSRLPDSPYVVFPGNVGGPDALADAIDILC